VNRLPPEVLASCATFVSDTDPRPIVTLTHVCRYWRRSISSNPRNWAAIATEWKGLVPLCLERAGAVPITVDITVSEVKGDTSFLDPLLSHVARVSHLSLTGYLSIEAVANDLPCLSAFPMPNLSSLELQQTEEPAELFPSSQAPLPPVFQNVSKLESLRLTRTPLYSALFSITSLRELRLTGYTSLFHFEEFVEFLASNLKLEIAALDVRFVEGSVRTLPGRMVALTRLRHLSITCTEPIDAKGLLSRITLSRGVHLEVTSIGTDQPRLDSFLPSPPTPIQRALYPITAIRFQYNPMGLRASGSNGSFSFRSSHPTSRRPEIYLFPAASVREFHVNMTPWPLFPAFLPWLLPQLPGLETLVITHCASFLTAAFDSLVGQPLLCPSLKTVAFFNCTLTPEAMVEFGDVMAKRKGSGAAWLHRVVIVSSTGPLPDYASVQRLRQHVPHVDVRVDDKLPDLP